MNYIHKGLPGDLNLMLILEDANLKQECDGIVQNGTMNCMKKIVSKLRDKIQYLQREIHREKRNFFHQNGRHERKRLLSIINSKMEKLRDEIINRRKRKLKRGEDLNISISRKKRNRRFHIKHKKNSSCRERRKARKVKSKNENIKNFNDVELTENQKRAICLGQGLVVCKSFNLGGFLLDWNILKNKIRWRLFFSNKDSSSLFTRIERAPAD